MRCSPQLLFSQLVEFIEIPFNQSPQKNRIQMKSIFIAFDQAYYERIIDMLEKNNCRGFTAWQEVQGRGSKSGEPHYGSHAWPSLASAIITFVDDSRVENVLNALHQMDIETPKLGLRAFVWDVEKNI